MAENTIKCTNCGADVEISKALQHEAQERIKAEERKKYEEETKRQQEIFKGEREQQQKNFQEEREKIEAAALAKAAEKNSLEIESAKKEAKEEHEENTKLRGQLQELMQEIREERKARQNAELEAQKRANEEITKAQTEARKQADDENKYKLAEKDKQLEAARKANEVLERKLNQGSQQLQGEVAELDLEDFLTSSFPEDKIEPIEKGKKGGDVRQTTRSPKGYECGIILWERKRTKAWTDGWIAKLKTDMRADKANVAVIVSDVLPADFENDMGIVDGVWICKPNLVLPLATLLRKGLLDVYLQKAITANKGERATLLFEYLTSHEFVQQIEIMIETYGAILGQISKERTAYSKIWAEREGQAQRLLGATANIVGSMQGRIGQSAMPRIKGLELLESGDEDG